MNLSNIHFRLKRLVASLTKRQTSGLNTTRVTKVVNDKHVNIKFDFGMGISEAECLNAVIEIIEAINKLYDHLKRNMTKLHDRAEADKMWSALSNNALIIRDIANLEKHGYGRGDSHSGHSPELKHVSSGLIIKGTDNEPGKIAFDPKTGQLKVSGSHGVQIDGQVVDKNGRIIMSASRLIEDAIQELCDIAEKYELADSIILEEVRSSAKS